MVNLSLKTNVWHVTNTKGETTDVLVPLELWQQLINTLQNPDSGLAWVDEHEPKAQLLTDLQKSIKQAATGQTFSVSQPWGKIET